MSGPRDRTTDSQTLAADTWLPMPHLRYHEGSGSRRAPLDRYLSWLSPFFSQLPVPPIPNPGPAHPRPRTRPRSSPSHVTSQTTSPHKSTTSPRATLETRPRSVTLAPARSAGLTRAFCGQTCGFFLPHPRTAHNPIKHRLPSRHPHSTTRHHGPRESIFSPSSTTSLHPHP